MSILDPVAHRRLIAEIDEIARTAGIPRRYIETSMTDVCGDKETEWVRGYRDHVAQGQYGLCFEGKDHVQQMMAMCGALIRNFVDSRVMPLGDVIEFMRQGEVPACSVLFIPSFHRTLKQGSGVTPFQINLLWQLLEGRLLQEKMSVIAVQSIAQLATDYGSHFRDLLLNHYEVI